VEEFVDANALSFDLLHTFCNYLLFVIESAGVGEVNPSSILNLACLLFVEEFVDANALSFDLLLFVITCCLS
jgi:hypothetical protein